MLRRKTLQTHCIFICHPQNSMLHVGWQFSTDPWKMYILFGKSSRLEVTFDRSLFENFFKSFCTYHTHFNNFKPLLTDFPTYLYHRISPTNLYLLSSAAPLWLRPCLNFTARVLFQWHSLPNDAAEKSWCIALSWLPRKA